MLIPYQGTGLGLGQGIDQDPSILWSEEVGELIILGVKVSWFTAFLYGLEGWERAVNV